MEPIKRRILTAVSLYHACNDASVVVLPALFPLLYDDNVLIKNYSDIGTITLIGLSVALLVQHLIGNHARIHHYRRYLALDALIVGVSLLLLAYSRNYFLLILFFVGVRIGTAVYHPVGIAWISHVFTGNRLDRAMGIQSAFGDVGVLAAFATTGFLAERFGWRLPVLLWSGVNLAALVSGLAISRGTNDRTDEAPLERVSWRETARRLKAYIPLFLLGGIAWGITLNFGPSLLNHRLGIPIAGTDIILACWMAAGTVSTLFYGRIAEGFGRAKILMIAFAVVVVSVLVMGMSTVPAVTVGAIIVYGLALFVTYPATLAFVGSVIDAKNRTAAFSLVSNISIVGNFTFAFISGRLSDAFGIHTPFLLLAGTGLLTILYLAAGLKRGTIPSGIESPRMKAGDAVCG
jgi:MFS family permease